MELVVATSIGGLTAAGIYLILRLRAFPVILGVTLLSYATNVFVSDAELPRHAHQLPSHVSRFVQRRRLLDVGERSDRATRPAAMSSDMANFGCRASIRACHPSGAYPRPNLSMISLDTCRRFR